jgi:hypothetical protein
MTLSAQEQNELRELAWSYHEGTLSADQAQRLEELVLRDAEACALFVRWSTMVNDLEWQCASVNPADISLAAVGEVEEDQVPPSSALLASSDQQSELLAPPLAESNLPVLSFIGKFFSGGNAAGGSGVGMPMFFTLLMAAMALTAGFTLWLVRDNDLRRTEGDRVARGSRIDAMPVAYLTSANGCAWGGDSVKTWTVGHSVESGSEIALHSGIAEFRLDNGVSFGMEGPASLLLASPSKLVLQYGKLTAHVPWGSGDFKIVLAGCRVAARDAEFGLSLTGEKLDIHVFSGEVMATNSLASAQADDEDVSYDENDFANAVITAGRALRLTARGEMLRVVGWEKAVPDHFVTKLSMSGPLTVTDEYVNQIKSAQPVGYWRFEQVSDSKIPNEIKSGPPLIVREHSSLVGDAGNLSAELHWGSNWDLRTDSKLPLMRSDYSIEAWVKPSHLHRGNLISLECQGRKKSNARIELQGGMGDAYSSMVRGSLRFVHRDYPQQRALSVSCFSSSPYTVRRWQHVAAVKTKSKMVLYIDGKRVGSSDLGEGLDFPKDVYVLVGLNSSISGRRFVGQVDELAIYDRALTEEEIVRHFNTVNESTTRSKQRESVPRPQQASKEA